MNKIVVNDPSDLVPVKVSMDEAEWTINAGRLDSSATIWCSDNTMLTKIKRVWKKAPNQFKVADISYNSDGTVAGYMFEMSKKNVSIHTFNEHPRMRPEMSPEMRVSSSERFKKMWAEKRANKEIENK